MQFKTKVNIGSTIEQGEESYTAEQYRAMTGKEPEYEFYFQSKKGGLVGIPISILKSEKEFYEQIG